MTVALVVGVTLIVLGIMLHVRDAGPRPTPRVRPNPNWADEEMLALWLRDNGGV